MHIWYLEYKLCRRTIHSWLSIVERGIVKKYQGCRLHYYCLDALGQDVIQEILLIWLMICQPSIWTNLAYFNKATLPISHDVLHLHDSLLQRFRDFVPVTLGFTFLGLFSGQFIQHLFSNASFKHSINNGKWSKDSYSNSKSKIRRYCYLELSCYLALYCSSHTVCIEDDLDRWSNCRSLYLIDNVLSKNNYTDMRA